jgi:hypothetical protein
MDTYGPPALTLIGKQMLDQQDRDQRQRRLALANTLMNQSLSPGAGAFEGFASGLNKGLGNAIFLKELSNGRKDSSTPSSESIWGNKGLGESVFGPDKIGIRDGIRGFLGLPK